MGILIKFIILLFGKFEGKDNFGNKYYTLKLNNIGRARRCVLFKGLTEPSKVPMEYELWLRHTTDAFPSKDKIFSWQKEKLPNLTGTKYSFDPSKYNSTIKSYNNYTSWRK